MSSMGNLDSGSAGFDSLPGSSGCNDGRPRHPSIVATQATPTTQRRHHPSLKPRTIVPDGVYDGDDDNTDLDIKIAKSENELKTKREHKPSTSPSYNDHFKEESEPEYAANDYYENALAYLPDYARVAVQKRNALRRAAALRNKPLEEVQRLNTKKNKLGQDMGSAAAERPPDLPATVPSEIAVSSHHERDPRMRMPGRYPSTSPSPSASPTVSPAPPPPTRIASPEGPQLPAPLLSQLSGGKQASIRGQKKSEQRTARLNGGNTLLSQTLSSAAATVAGRACELQTCERFERHHGNKDRASGYFEPCSCDSSNSVGLKAPARSATAPNTLKNTNVQNQTRNYTSELPNLRNLAIAKGPDNATKSNQIVGYSQQQQPPMPGPFPNSEKDSYYDQSRTSQVTESVQKAIARLRMLKEARCPQMKALHSQSSSSKSTIDLSKKLLEKYYEESKNKDENCHQKCEEQKKLVGVAAAEPKVGDNVVTSSSPHQKTSGANSSAPLKRTAAGMQERGKEPYKNDILKKTNKPSITPSSSVATMENEETKNGETPRSANAGDRAQARETTTAAPDFVVGSPKKPADAAAPLAKNIVAAQASGLHERFAGIASGATAATPVAFAAASPAQPNDPTSVQKQPPKRLIAVPDDTKLDGFEEVDITADGEQELADWDVVQKGDGDETWAKYESGWNCEEDEAFLETDGDWAKVPYEEVI